MTTHQDTAKFAASLSREMPTLAPHEIGKLVSTLIRGATSLHKRYEAICSYEWANTPAYERATEKKEATLLALAKDAGLIDVHFGRDPRGTTMVVKVPSGASDDWERFGMVVPCCR